MAQSRNRIRWWGMVVPALALAGCQRGADMDRTEPEAVTVIEHCGTITDSATWTADVQHRLTCDVVVEGSLTLEPGVEVIAEQGTALRVHGGSLDARGSSDEPLLFASAAAFPVAGDWVGIEALDADITLAFATVRHAGSEGALLQLEGGQASISTIILSNSDQRGLYADGTEFSQLEEIEVAYVEEPITIPWAGAAVLSGVVLDQVEGAAVRLLGDTLDVPVGLEAIDVPYLSDAVSVAEGGNLWVEEGAILAVTGDIEVAAGGAIVMRGSAGNTAALIGWEGASYTVSIDEAATMADFRWASIVGGAVESAAAELSFRYSDITAAPGTALSITGEVDRTVYAQLTDNSFAGEGLGLVVPLPLLDTIGENDYSGSSFDGVVVRGGSFAEDLSIGTWPTSNILVQGDLHFTEGVVSLANGTLSFADGTALVADGAQLVVDGMVFTHIDEVAGGWEGITVGDTEALSTFDNCEVAYGGAWDGANITLRSWATVMTSTLRRSAGWGILVEQGGHAVLHGNIYEGNAQGDVGP